MTKSGREAPTEHSTRAVTRVIPRICQYLDDFRTYYLQIYTQTLQHARGNPFTLSNQAKQQVLGPDVMVAEATCLVDRQLNHLLGARRQADFTRYLRFTAANDEVDGGPYLAKIDAKIGEHFRGDSFSLTHQAQQQ